MANHPAPPWQILKGSLLQDMLRRIDFHAEMLRRVKAGLPAAMADHCVDCVVREDGGLVVFTDSQAFAAQLRFLAPGIQTRLNDSGDVAIKQVTIRKLPPAPIVDKPMSPMQAPAPDAIAAVKAGGQSAPGDELAQALARLGASMERFALLNPKKNAADPNGPDGVVADGEAP
ncbi:MAG: DciA family protein [Candidatus Methylumidiphilus sp.]